MKRVSVLATLTLCGLLAACGNGSDNHLSISTGDTDMLNGNIRLGHGQVTLRAHDAPDASISANGDLQINQQSVATDPAVRELLKSYYENAMMVRTDGIATGKAGEAIGEEVAKNVASNLASGHPDQIQPDVEAKAQLVKQAALKICEDIGNIQTAQNQLVTQLPAFKPYGNIVSASDVSDCKSDTYVK
jgi:hypothetical protein